MKSTDDSPTAVPRMKLTSYYIHLDTRFKRFDSPFRSMTREGLVSPSLRNHVFAWVYQGIHTRTVAGTSCADAIGVAWWSSYPADCSP